VLVRQNIFFWNELSIIKEPGENTPDSFIPYPI